MTNQEKQLNKKCKFDKPDGCHALVCFSRQPCGARDKKGNPKYVAEKLIEVME